MKKIFITGFRILNYYLFVTFFIFSVLLLTLYIFGGSYLKNLEQLMHFITSKVEYIVYLQILLLLIVTAIVCILIQMKLSSIKYALTFSFLGGIFLIAIVYLLAYDMFPYNIDINEDKIIFFDWIGNLLLIKGSPYRDYIHIFTIWPSYYFLGAFIGGIIDFILWKKNNQ